MATVGLYGSSSSGVVAAASGSESTGLYGNNVNFGGSYFEWFIFIQSDTQPATPTGGSWSFTTNSGTPPTGWSSTPFANPTNKIWVSIALVNSKNSSSLVWSEPGLFSYASGLPILSGSSAPQPTDGQSDQLYIETGTTPETIWFKQVGTWTRLTGSSLYVDLTSNQTIAGTKTFNNTIQGSVSGTSNNVTGIVGISNGGTGSTTASGARTALGAAASGANSDITSLSGITNGISSPDYIQFDVNPTTIPTTPGALYWDTADGNQTLSLVMANGNAVQQIGEEQFYRIKASSAITNGQVVMFTGTVGASGALTGAPATGLTASTASYVMGIATQDIPLNGWGYVTSFGLVRQLDTSAFTAGQILYLDPAVPGGLTATLPVAPNPKIQVCACIYSSASNGSLFIRPSFGGILGQYEGDVDVTSVAAYNLLQRNSTNTKWTNVAGPAGAVVGTTDTQTLTNKTISGASNTLSNIGNASLTNSSITINGSTVSLGGSTTVTATATNALTIGTGLSGTSYNGSTAVTIANTGVLSFSGGTTGLTPSTATTGAVTLAGTLAVANGGTGATTAAAAATNLGLGTGNSPSFTGLTLSAGTANGVPYLNASKVLTTGSALTFDGTTFKVVGSDNTTAPFMVQGSNAGNGIIQLGTNNTAYQIFGGSYWGQMTYNTAASTPHIWWIGGSEQMRLTSTGLGIGTSSVPSYAGYKTIAINGTSGGEIDFLDGGTTRGQIYSASSGMTFTTLGAIPLYLGTNGSTKATLDSSGNLGLGVTPSAWYSDYRAFQISSTSAVYGRPGTNETGITQNWYRDSSAVFRYIGNGYAASYTQLSGGGHAWFNGANNVSGAGAALTLTQAMTLDASGNLGLGTTIPTGVSNYGAMTINGTNGGLLDLKYGNTLSGRLVGSTGSLGIEVTGASNYLYFYLNSTERARIDSSGNLLVGKTSTDFATQGIALRPVDGVSFTRSSGSVLDLNRLTSDGEIVGFYRSGTKVGNISVTTTSTTYNTSSDYRLKDNIQPMTGALAKVAALKPCTYNWKADGSEGEGFIAHELAEVVPQCVTGEKDAVDAEGNPVYQGIDTSFLVATLTAAIQELKAEFDAYKATHP